MYEVMYYSLKIGLHRSTLWKETMIVRLVVFGPNAA